jgi:hypothetical protein
MPADPAEEARCIGTMCWFSSVVHPSCQHSHRPERFAEGEAALIGGSIQFSHAVRVLARRE